MKKLWFIFIAIFIFSFAILGWVGTEIFRQAPPIPSEVVTTDAPSAFPIMGVSGFIEVVGLTLWAYELVRNMRAGVENEKRALTPDVRPRTVTPLQTLQN